METNRTVPNARQRVREAVRADIVAEARRQLAEVGGGALSLRSVARELGMASSAMYRYFPSRDDLLTTLIVEAYDALGEAAELAATTSDRAYPRWLAVCRAVRQWAFDHPQEYALIYGSPVPGYQAPADTVVPGSRVTLVLAGILADAERSGELSPMIAPAPSRALSSAVRPIAQLFLPDVSIARVAMGLLTWTQLFGQINFELFGRYEGVVENPELLFEHAVAVMAWQFGLTPTRTGRS
jgi:AcrR family transcriptional regulator